MSTLVRDRKSNAFTISADGLERILSARPDTLDFRDKMYIPTLVEVPPVRDLSIYRKSAVPVLDQGQEGACTGFGLATVANYLLRSREHASSNDKVSPRMMYEMAKKYDEWPGEEYEGSSARGAMKGWHKHGVCSEDQWAYSTNGSGGYLTRERAEEAKNRPLGAYFRVNHRDLVAMHSAISETGILYATGMVHRGWSEVESDGHIEYSRETLGGHAFAIVAYDREGFWIQNSWGTSWGFEGYAHISYDDWLENGTDVWVARLGAPINLKTFNSVALIRSAVANNFEAYSFSDLRPHIVSIGNDGRLTDQGTYGTNEQEVTEIVTEYLPEITRNWSKKRLLVYAHGGLTSESSAIQMLADRREILLENEIYPISIIWRTDFWTTIRNIIKDALRQMKPEGLRETAKEFLFDRIDDSLEPISRIPGKMSWDEMKENALLSTTSQKGGARYLADVLASNSNNFEEVHFVGFSAGSIFNAPLIKYLVEEKRISVKTLSLWAPACTVELFKECYQPLLNNEKSGIHSFQLYTMDDKTERDDNCRDIYHKSLLYLVSHAFEDTLRIPFSPDPKHQGVPILGMAKFVDADPSIKSLFNGNSNHEWIVSPNDSRSKATSHGGFDNDESTLKSTLRHILGKDPKLAASQLAFQQTPKSLDKMRVRMAQNLLSDDFFLA